MQNNQNPAVEAANEPNNLIDQPGSCGYEYINQQCCCFNLRKATRAITQYYDRCLEITNLRSTQFTLLIALDSIKAKTLTEIAENLVMDRTTLTRNLKPLTKIGLITMINSSDKRSKAYILTDQGKQLLINCIPLWQNAQKHVINSLGIENYQDLFDRIAYLTSKISLLK